MIRIKNKVIRGSRNIIDPEYIGFASSVDKIVKQDMSNMILDNLDRLVPARSAHYDVIPVVLNPRLHVLQAVTQEYITRDNVDLRTWMEEFSNRKRLMLNFGIVNAPVTAQNYDDFRKIIMSIVLPQQVMIDIGYENEENAVLSGTVGLMAKMLFSTTPGYRSITMRSAYETDVVIGRMLTKMGYTNNDQHHPLAVTTSRGGGGILLELFYKSIVILIQ